MVAFSSRPRLAPNVRLRFERSGGRLLAVLGQRSLELDAMAADVLRLCTGKRTVDGIIGALTGSERGAQREDLRRSVIGCLNTLVDAAVVLNCLR